MVKVTAEDEALARRIVMEFRPQGWEAKCGEIASLLATHRERATLAEQERCAGKADAEMVECENIALSCDAGSREREVYDTAASVCRVIAKAIRNDMGEQNTA